MNWPDDFIDRVICGDALEVMPQIPDNSINLIATDPPYYKVKGEAWDRQWETPQGYLAWLEKACEQWYRILKPNGSLYVFASPQMAARVECKIGERFNVLNRIRWIKEDGWHKKVDETILRSYLSPWEEIIFAEHYGADGYAKGENGWGAKCDELRGFVFEPLRAYLDGERKQAGISQESLHILWCRRRGTKGHMVGHWFGQSQWALPTAENYEWLRQCLNRNGGEYLRREYEYLRREYEYLRRPFSVSADVPYTDVWNFPTVQAYPGKHPCEKPLKMMLHIVNASSRPGDLVLDCFAGYGTTAMAARLTGRHYVAIDSSPQYCQVAEQRLTGILL